mmetsp:Transcript_14195/g.19369  ORF Transcript_14195/g.19369 Transcript_14195/m.19369 type:complete len:542 (-) Transcript_14195:60-1685(-)
METCGCGAPALVPPAVGDKRSIHDIGQWDMNTNNYWDSLTPVLPDNGTQLKQYVDNPLLKVRKMALYPSHVAVLEEQAGFSELLHEIYDPTNGVSVCQSVSESLLMLSMVKLAISRGNKNTMITFMDVVFGIFEVFVNQPRRRNVSNKTSGPFKPDNMYCDGARGDVYLVGEEKPKAEYRQGIVGKDPAAENLHKTQFNNWEKCYGSLPFIFAYDAVGDHYRVEFNFGVIDKDTRSFVKLFSGNLAAYRNRAAFALVLFKILPVLKSVIERAASSITPMFHVQTSFANHNTIRKEVTMLHHNGFRFIEKKWTWTSHDENFDQHAQEAFMFCARLKSVFAVIDAAADDHEGFSLLKSLHRQIGSRMLEISTIGVTQPQGETLPRAIEGETIAVKGFFTPIADPVTVVPQDGIEYVNFVLNVALSVSFLHSLSIVHNDLRPVNIGMCPDNPTGVVLFDFDDAYLLTEAAPQCPPLPHLSLEEHPEKSCYKPHGKEVDVWAVGFLLARCSATKSLGANIKENFETLTIEDAIQGIRLLLTNLLS